MSRLLFPQDRTAFLYTGPGEPIRQPWMTGLTMYLDSDCTLLADLIDIAGDPLPGSQVFIGANGLLPPFYGPVSGISRLWAKPPVDDPFPVDAAYVPGQPDSLLVSRPGVATVASGGAHYYNDTGYTWTVTMVRASAGTAPVGGDLVLRMKVDGTQVALLTIPDGLSTSGAILLAGVEVSVGSYVSFDVVSVGTGPAGADLTINLTYVQTPVPA